MNDKRRFSFQARLSSFGYAFSGLWSFLRSEHNAWIHLFVATVTLILSFLVHISAGEWIAVILCMAMVITTEILNTVIEKIMDHLSPEYSTSVKTIKDMAAAAVLVTSIAAAITGLIIFIPRFI